MTNFIVDEEYVDTNGSVYIFKDKAYGHPGIGLFKDDYEDAIYCGYANLTPVKSEPLINVHINGAAYEATQTQWGALNQAFAAVSKAKQDIICRGGN
tara:strand:+ start:474 stop:764 length:291 start_codon:yes stop_codon:yes gene_type:complete